MTEILESDGTEDLAPDMWAGVTRHYDPRPQMELDRLAQEFFMRGGVATWLPPQDPPAKRKHDLYFAPEPEKTQGGKVHNKLPGDEPHVKVLDALLNQEWPSRRQLAMAAGISDQFSQRILGAHFADDPRADKFQRGCADKKKEDYEKIWQQRLDVVNAALEIGIRGYGRVAKATGLSPQVLAVLAERHDLKITTFAEKNNGTA